MFDSNIITHQVLGGDYTMICRWLVRDLIERGLWTDDLRSQILRQHGAYSRPRPSCANPTVLSGSVQSIDAIPDDLKDIYRTTWEIEPFSIVEMASDRAPYIDQSQSMSLTVAVPSTPLLVRGFWLLIALDLSPYQLKLQTRAWEQGLKTGVYYLRTKAPIYPLPYGMPALSSASSTDSDEPPPLIDAEDFEFSNAACTSCDG